MEGLNDATALYVNAYPTAWRIETIDEGIHRGFEYVRSELSVDHTPEQLTDAVHQILLGTHKEDLGSIGGPQRQRREGGMLFIDTNCPWS